MKTKSNKIFQLVVLAVSLTISAIFVSCGQDNKNTDHQSMSMDNKQIDSSIVRVGVIDLQAIDQNKDGMVYQDPMDWNVISDEAGRCPICKMKLKEVTLEEAKMNLINNGFKIKEN
jgi:Cu(I)/Ag(I) efflux system membrane fusion protein/cobalt-zinc-cadmium efflux system membrane fusion protein